MKSIIPLLLFLFMASYLPANNITISNVVLTGQNTTAGVNNAANYVMVQFSLNWENSWRISGGPANWDAAWIFIKYRISGGGWLQAILNNTGNTPPSGSIIDIGLVRPVSPYNAVTNPVVGAFIYRSTNGSGTFNLTNVQLRWNYGAQAVTDDALVEVKVFGIEMVFIPQGAFNAGGGGGTSAFTSTTINTGNAVTVPSGSGSLGGQAGGFPTGETAPASFTWPNGYAQIYCMKYEISQQQYVDFLNTLTRTQQGLRVATVITGTSITNRYVLSNTSVLSLRNGIRCDASIPASPASVNFYCDMSGNGFGSESNDGQWIACNYLSWADLAAYLDWSGLRPMTELEYEKICRGVNAAVLNEYAWGNAAISNATSAANSGQASEIAGNAGANAVLNSFTGVQGPLRVGSFSNAATNREQSGASYYGVMEMTGNVWERPVTIGNVEGRSFNGIYHGDGTLTTAGDANVTSWPDITAAGVGIRGGGWNGTTVNTMVSDRTSAVLITGVRASANGGRGVRGAP